MKIMLVDDDKYVLEGLKELLDWKAFDGKLTATASNGKEALALFSHSRPDVIISDIKMPVMDGIMLAQHIYEQEMEISMILLSGYGDFEYARKAIAYKVTNYILKPITRDKIKELQDLLIKISQTRQQQREDFLSNWDHSFKESILTALRNQEPKTFDEFFSSSLFEEKLSADSSNAFGIQLLNFLYQYLSELHIDTHIVAAAKEKAMRDYWDLPSKDEKANYLISTYYDTMTSVHTQKNKNLDSISSYICEYVKTHFTEPNLNISSLADKINVSLSYLSTVFKQTEGINLSTYIGTLRLNRAKELLLDPCHPISEVAIRSGYEDAKYFAKLFKKKTGMTPSEYRNLTLQKHALLPYGDLP